VIEISIALLKNPNSKQQISFFFLYICHSLLYDHNQVMSVGWVSRMCGIGMGEKRKGGSTGTKNK
jgi:hypothetical protein